MRLFFLTAAVALAQNATYPVKPVPFTAVHFHDDFWAPRIEINRKATIPAAFAQLEKAGDFDNFDRAATVLRGEPLANKAYPKNPYDDSDVFKVIEGASTPCAPSPTRSSKRISINSSRASAPRRKRTAISTPPGPSIRCILIPGLALSAGCSTVS